MIARKRLCLALLLCFVVVFTDVARTYAISIAPHVIRIELRDGMEFIMIPHNWPYEEEWSQSGLYRDGELVYAFDKWLAWERLYFANDSMTFMTNTGFYSHGALGHRFNPNDFWLDFARVHREWFSEPRLYGPPLWVSTRHNRLDETITRTTIEGSMFTLCLTTGLIVDYYWATLPESVEYEPPEQIFAIVAVVAILLAVAGLVVRKSLQRKS